MSLVLAALITAAAPSQVQFVLPDPSAVIPAMKTSLDLVAPVLDLRRLEWTNKILKPVGFELLKPQTWAAAGLDAKAPAHIYIDGDDILFTLKVKDKKLLQQRLQNGGETVVLGAKTPKGTQSSGVIGVPGRPELGLIVRGAQLWVMTLPRRLLAVAKKDRAKATQKLAEDMTQKVRRTRMTTRDPEVAAPELGPEVWVIADQGRGRVAFGPTGIELSGQLDLPDDAEAAVGGTRLKAGAAPSPDAVAWLRGWAELKDARQRVAITNSGLDGHYHFEFLENGGLHAALGLTKKGRAKKLIEILEKEGWITQIRGRRLLIWSEAPTPKKPEDPPKTPWPEFAARKDAGVAFGTRDGTALLQALKLRADSKVGPKPDPTVMSLIALAAGPSVRRVRAITASAKRSKKQLSVKARVDFVASE